MHNKSAKRTDGQANRAKNGQKAADGGKPGRKATHTARQEGKGSAGSRKRIQNFSGNRSHFVIFANKRVKFQGAPQWGMWWKWIVVAGWWGAGVVLAQSPVGRHVRAIFGIQLTREIAHAD